MVSSLSSLVSLDDTLLIANMNAQLAWLFVEFQAIDRAQ
jgi:hypothetical protein